MSNAKIGNQIQMSVYVSEKQFKKLKKLKKKTHINMASLVRMGIDEILEQYGVSK